MLEAGDFIYFRYGLKRTSTHELGLTNDTSVLPMVIRDFWFVFLLVMVLIIIVELLYRKQSSSKGKRGGNLAAHPLSYPDHPDDGHRDLHGDRCQRWHSA